MMYIIECGLLAFSIVFSIGIAIVMVIWISVGLSNLVDSMEKRAKERRNRIYQQMFRGIQKDGYQPTSNLVSKNPPQGKKSGGAQAKKG